jgi:hypothetical protein
MVTNTTDLVMHIAMRTLLSRLGAGYAVLGAGSVRAGYAALGAGYAVLGQDMQC